MAGKVVKTELLKEQKFVEESILMYFNNYLYDNHFINENEKNKMIRKISNRSKLDNPKFTY